MSEEKQEGAAAPAAEPKRSPGRPKKVQPEPAAAPVDPELPPGAAGVSEDAAVGPIEPAAAPEPEPASEPEPEPAAAPPAPAAPAEKIRVRATRSLGMRTIFSLSPEVEREVTDPEVIAWIRKNHPEIILGE